MTSSPQDCPAAAAGSAQAKIALRFGWVAAIISAVLHFAWSPGTSDGSNAHIGVFYTALGFKYAALGAAILALVRGRAIAGIVLFVATYFLVSAALVLDFSS